MASTKKTPSPALNSEAPADPFEFIDFNGEEEVKITSDDDDDREEEEEDVEDYSEEDARDGDGDDDDDDDQIMGIPADLRLKYFETMFKLYEQAAQSKAVAQKFGLFENPFSPAIASGNIDTIITLMNSGMMCPLKHLSSCIQIASLYPDPAISNEMVKIFLLFSKDCASKSRNCMRCRMNEDQKPAAPVAPSRPTARRSGGTPPRLQHSKKQ